MNEVAKRAREILSGKHLLVGREIEDCQHGKVYTRSDGEIFKNSEYHMIMVRPFNKNSYLELFNHGEKYCSKFEIYGISDNFIIRTRPDQWNYSRTEYKFELTGDWVEQDYVNAVLKEREDRKDLDLNSHARGYFEQFVLGKLDSNLGKAVDIIELSDNSYNIIIEE